MGVTVSLITFRIDWTKPENRERFPADACSWCGNDLDDLETIQVVVVPLRGNKHGETHPVCSDTCRDTIFLKHKIDRSRVGKTPWHEIEPVDATKISLPNDSVWGPITSEGVECPWPWEPQQLVGVPMGQYHCGYCLEMVIAGVPHTDYAPKETGEQAQGA